jgi:O-antigen/teichoic acid export membrane protein
MAINRQDIYNILWLLVAQTTAALVGVFAFSRVGGQLQVSELGRYSFAVTSTVSFGLLAELGVRYVAMREIAISPERTGQVYRHGSILRWLLSAASLLLLSLIAIIGPWHDEVWLLLLAGLVAVTQFGSDPATWVFFGRGRVDIGAVILIVDRLLYLVAINVGAYIFQSAQGLIFAALSANLLRMAGSAFWVRSAVPADSLHNWDRRIFRQLIGSGVSLGVAIIAFVTYSSVPVVLMRTLAAPEELGYFAMGFGIVSLVLVIPTSLTMALFPTFAQRFNESKQARSQLYERVARFNLLIALPICIGLLVFPLQILVIWIGVLNETAALNLRILAVSLPVTALNFMYRLFLFALDEPIYEAGLNVAGITVTIVLGYIMYQSYGGPGVALTYVIVEIGIVLAKALLVRQWLGSPRFGLVLLRALAAYTLPTFLLVERNLPLLVRVCAYSMVVLLLIFVLKLIPEEIVRLVKGVLSRKKLDYK